MRSVPGLQGKDGTRVHTWSEEIDDATVAGIALAETTSWGEHYRTSVFVLVQRSPEDQPWSLRWRARQVAEHRLHEVVRANGGLEHVGRGYTDPNA